MGTLRSALRSLKLIGYFMQAAGELIVDDPETRHDRAEWLHQFCARAMKGMGIVVAVRGNFPERGALISNHLSYLDVVTLASLHPCVFVSKAEIAEFPVLGWMTTRSGTVYVERGRGGSAIRASSAMQRAMDDGLPVVFFPEGTTSDGTALLKFHSGLLGQALSGQASAAGTPATMTACFIRYSLTQPNDPGTTVAVDVCWGERPLLLHIWKFLGLHGIHAQITFGDAPIVFSSDALHRKSAALEAQAAMAALGGGVPVEIDNPVVAGADLERY